MIHYNIKDQYQKEINNEDIQKEKNKNFEEIFDKFNQISRNEMIRTFYNNHTSDSKKKEEILNTYYRSDRDNRTVETNKLKDLLKNRDTLFQNMFSIYIIHLLKINFR